MKKIVIFFVLMAFLIGCVNAEDIDLNDTTVENEMIVDNSFYFNESYYCDYDDNINISEYDDNLNESIYDENLEVLNMNTTGVVMSDDEYSCGAASFATVLNNLGINITLNESKVVVNTTINGTTMQGIIDGAEKYNLTSFAVFADYNTLNENYIVHMTIDGVDHWSVVKQISENYVLLADPSMGNINYTKNDFNHYYTNKAIVIVKSNDNIVDLKSDDVKLINKDYAKFVSGKVRIKNSYTKIVRYTEYRIHNWKLQWRTVKETKYYYSYKEYKSWKAYYSHSNYKYSKWHNCW